MLEPEPALSNDLPPSKAPAPLCPLPNPTPLKVEDHMISIASLLFDLLSELTELDPQPANPNDQQN